MHNWKTKKLGEVLVGIVFILSAGFLFIKEEYGYGVILVVLLLVLLKLQDLQNLVFNIKDGFSAKFNISKEKTEENIKENEQEVTKENFFHFSRIESKILEDLQKKYNGEMKTLIHFMYGFPDKPQFRYTPDGTLQTKDTLYFFEIKYILKPEFAENIVNNTLRYLKEVYTKLLPSIGNKKFIIKLILASGYDLSKISFVVPSGIEIEFYKV